MTANPSQGFPSGALRHAIIIQSLADTPTGTTTGSDITTTYTNLYTLRARIEALKGTVYFDTKQIGEGITHKITIRKYSSAITTEHWILWDSRRFRIRAVRDLFERKRWTEFLCEEEGTT